MTGFEKIAYLAKRPYRTADIGRLDPSNENEAWTAKIDGAHTIVDFNKGKLPKLYSHRISKRTGGTIEYTPKLTHIKHKSPVTATLRAETFAVDKKGKAVHPDTVTAMLNRGLERSLELQREQGMKTRVALIDVDKVNGTDVSAKPFSWKRSFMEGIAKKNPDFTLPDVAYTPKEKTSLLKKVKSGKHPQTLEGLIVHNVSEPGKQFAKAKITNEHDVYVRKIFQEESATGRKPMAGGFEYSWERGGEPVGKVGTGFDHAMKTDMLHNPEKYLGRVARVSAASLSRNKVLMKPAFEGWHVEKNIEAPKFAKQTVIINKSMTTDREAAKELARPFADRIYTARETDQSYRFRQLPPGKFVPGTFRTFSPKKGVSLVYGQLKGE